MPWLKHHQAMNPSLPWSSQTIYCSAPCNKAPDCGLTVAFSATAKAFFAFAKRSVMRHFVLAHRTTGAQHALGTIRCGWLGCSGSECPDLLNRTEIGRASGWERVCQYV